MRTKIRSSRWFWRVRRRLAMRKLRHVPRGSAAWFVETEIKYGGLVVNVPRNKTSPHDSRHLPVASATGTNAAKTQAAGASRTGPRPGGMRGGDRMLVHGYAPKYAQYVAPYLDERRHPPTIMEIGILRGTGLAVWSDLFPSSRLIGLDIDLSHTRRNLPALKAMGAFPESDPELYEFDQFAPDNGRLAALLNGDRVDICIDDAAHESVAIIRTLDHLMPQMNDSFVYFVEDNATVCDEIRARYPGCAIESSGELTIISLQRPLDGPAA